LAASTSLMLAAIYTFLKPAIAAFMLLTVVIFGIKITSGGVRDVRAEMALLTIKLAGVAYFTQNFADWYPDIIASVQDSIEIVTKPMLKNILVCPGVSDNTLWARMDCMFATLLGLTVAGAAGVTLLGNELHVS